MSNGISIEHRRQFLASMLAELKHAYAKHGGLPWSRHEFAGVLMEEVDELWEAIKRDAPMGDVLMETMQVACVCLRYAETADRYLGPHALPLPSRCREADPFQTLNPVRPRSEYHEDCGVVLWWDSDVADSHKPPYVGTPNDMDDSGMYCLPDDYLWWSPLPDLGPMIDAATAVPE